MFDTLLACLVGSVSFFCVAAVALRLLLEKLTERNLAYIRKWEADAFVDGSSSKSKPQRERRGKHRRAANTEESVSFADSVVKECAATVTIDGNAERYALPRIGGAILLLLRC